MITYKVGICDDEADEVKKIEDLLHEYEATHNIHFEIHSYTDGLKLLRDYQKPHMLHALFLDVEMALIWQNISGDCRTGICISSLSVPILNT